MRIPSRLAPLAAGASHPDLPKVAANFVARIWAPLPPEATTFAAFRQGPRWIEQPITGNRQSAVRKFLETHPAQAGDLYFCPNGFSTTSRKTEFALGTCLAWCDIDKSNPKGFKPRPNILWETSTGNYQGLWLWNKVLDPHTAEQISKSLLRFGGDKGGWSVTKTLRIPGTINHKPKRNRDRVRLLRFDERHQPVPDLVVSPVPSRVIGGKKELNPARFGAAEVIKRYRRQVSLFARTLMNAQRVIYPDRSEAIYVIVLEMINAGAENDEIGCTLLANPHFLDKHGDNEAMAEREILTIRAKLGGDQ